MFYKEIEDDRYHRYRSWEHCYTFFQKHKNSGKSGSMEIKSLHLAFYLASWGMYRGSSNLLQKDYPVHKQIVAELFAQKYEALWNIDFDAIDENGLEINSVFQLAKTITQLYKRLQISPTDTLVTKVLLGTLGCIPAYDTLFINGVTYWNQALSNCHKQSFPARFGQNSYRGLIDFYRENREDFLDAQAYISKRGTIYPVMKLADMYFWSLGSQIGR